MRIEVKAMNVCGQVRFYPVNKAAILLTKLTKTATFTMIMLRNAKDMGAELVLVNRDEASKFMIVPTMFEGS